MVYVGDSAIKANLGWDRPDSVGEDCLADK
jgi:hypothetical protein